MAARSQLEILINWSNPRLLGRGTSMPVYHDNTYQ